MNSRKETQQCIAPGAEPLRSKDFGAIGYPLILWAKRKPVENASCLVAAIWTSRVGTARRGTATGLAGDKLAVMPPTTELLPSGTPILDREAPLPPPAAPGSGTHIIFGICTALCIAILAILAIWQPSFVDSLRQSTQMQFQRLFPDSWTHGRILSVVLSNVLIGYNSHSRAWTLDRWPLGRVSLELDVPRTTPVLCSPPPRAQS
jgi:hypothetical protein